jgi:hypothetical protein
LAIAAGTVQLAGSGGDQMYDGAGVTLSSGVLDLSGHSETIYSLNGAGGIIDDKAFAPSPRRGTLRAPPCDGPC